MPDKDEFTEKFHEMRELMAPPPELLSRLSSRLEDSSTDVASQPAHDRTRRSPSGKPDVARQPSRPAASGKRRRIGILSGGATAVALAAVMVVSGLTGNRAVAPSPWPTWPDPVVVSGSAGPSAKTRAADPGAYADVYQALAATSQYQYYMTKDTAELPMPALAGAAQVAEDASGSTMSTSAGPYISESGTNVQVAGIDEGDIVKTDGEYLYVAKGRTVAVVAAQGADSRQVARIEIAGLVSGDEIAVGPVMDMMIEGKTLVVLFHGFSGDVPDWSASWGDYLSLNASSLKAAFYDISDPGRPQYLSQVSQSGSYVDSRLSDGILYLVSRYSVSPENADPLDPVTYVPSVDPGDGGAVVDPGDISILPWADSPMYSMVTAIDVADRTVMSEQAVLGRSDTLYMSAANLYLASADWPYYPYSGNEAKVTIPGYEGYEGVMTNIVRIGLNAGHLSVGAEAVLPGTLINQFALDEQDGYLRAVTTARTSEDWAEVPGLWVLDSSLSLVGSLPELVTNEQVQSVRFDGNVGYVVTFERVDPLFAIDLTDPADPKVMSALKIPGFSSYLHPYGQGLLLGIGTDADTSGRSTGLKLSMYDVSDPFDVQEVASIHIDADSTDVTNDHKAAFVDLEHGLIGLPTMTYSSTVLGGSRISCSWDYRIYAWTGTGFQERSTISLFHSDDGSYPSDTTTRGVGAGNDFYLLTSATVDAYDFAGFSQTAHVTLT